MASGSESSGNDESHSQSYVFRGQEPHLLNAYSRAQALSYQQADIGARTAEISEPLFEGGQQALHGLLGTMDQFRSIADGSNQGMQTLSDLQQGGINPHLQGMAGKAGRLINNNLQRNILPSIRSAGNAANPYGGGGSRQGIAEGIAMSDADQAYNDTISQLFGQAYDADQSRRLQAAQGYIGAGLEAGGAASTVAGNYLSGSQSLINLGLSPYNQQWMPLMNYKQVVGNPAILSTSDSFGNNSSSSWGVL